MVVALTLFISSYGVVRSDRGRIWMAIGWTAFVLGWAVWLRHGRSAQAAGWPRSRAARRRFVVEWIALFILSNAIVQGLGRVSWALAGLAMAGLWSGWGIVAGRRWRHA